MGTQAVGRHAAAGLIAALLAWPAAPRAHPHGVLDCALQLGAADGPGPPRLGGLTLQLTLDAASSQSLLPRLRLDDAAQPPPRPTTGAPGAPERPWPSELPDVPEAPEARQARLFAQMLAGLFRQSGWMLQLRAAGAESPAPELEDPAPPRFARAADGRLQVTVQLQPAAGAAALPLDGLQSACRDPVWYWLTGFRQASQVQPPAGWPGCQAQLGALQREAEQARALQSAAREAGAAGADQMAPGLGAADGRRSPTVTMRCDAP